MDRLSDEYLVRTNESLYSVQSMTNIRIRLIFYSSNTLVNRLGPNLQAVSHIRCWFGTACGPVATASTHDDDYEAVALSRWANASAWRFHFSVSTI